MGIKHSWPGVAKFKIAATLWSLGLVLCVVVLAALLAVSFTAFAAASPTPGFDKYEGLSGQAPTFVGTKGFAPVPGVKSPSETMETAFAPASVVRYEQSSPAVDLSGSWWTLAHSSASGGSYARGSGESSVATFSFTGTYVALVATKGPTMGRAIVSVDGGAESTVNLNSSAVGYQWTVWSAGGLASGEHEVTVWWDMTNTEGTYINIDAFDVSMSGTGSISGKVTNSSGTALPDVAVLAIDGDGEAIGGSLTGANGTYSITGLSNQSVKVVTLNDLGYIDEWYSNVVAPGNWDGVGATALNLASTPTRTGINFSLAVGKTISGRVTYESLPVEGMEVEAYDEDLNWCASGRADANGHYDITGLPAGRYLVATYDEAGWWIDEWYDNDLVPLDPDGDSATLIDVRTSNAVNKDFALERPATIWGRVTSSTGTGLADIQIRVQLVGEEFTVYAWTNAQGDYFLGGLPNGDYVVNTANDQGYVDEWYDNDPAPGDIFGENVTPIHLSGGWMVDFSLDRGYSISGAVTDNTNDQPPADPGMVVNVFDASGKWCAFNFVDAESAGFYTTWALPAGTYYAEASDSWGDTGLFLGSSYVDEWYDDLPCGQYDLADADPIVLSSANVAGIDFGLDRLNRYEQTDTRIVYNPAWTTFPTPSASAGSYAYSNVIGSSATVYFNGTRLDWIAMTGTTTGLADVYLDDELFANNIDLSAESALYQVKVWTTGCLPLGFHKVVIAYEPTNPVGKRITLDVVEIAGTLVDAPPTVTALSPSSGTGAGGTVVTITGTKLAGATAVMFGDAAATSVNVLSSTRLTCTSPAHEAGVVDVTVTTPGGTSLPGGTGNDFTFTVPAPTVTGLSPATGGTAGGETITIAGTYLTGATEVTFGGLAATVFNVDSATQITAAAPAHAAGTVDVTVTTPGGVSSATGTGNEYTYVAPSPTVTAVDPISGTTSGGASVSITGTGLTGATAVTFGGTAATNIVVGSDTQITCTTPAHVAGTVNVQVTTAGGATSTVGVADDYTYVAPLPAVTGLSPTTGSTTGGAKVTVTGTGFIGATGVTFGDAAATNVAVVSPTQITCTIPAHDAGTVSVLVTTAGGTSSADGAGDDFTYTLIVDPDRYDQTNGNIVKTGAWIDFDSTAAYGGSYGRSSTAGASATVWFTGTKIAWIGMKGSTPGIVDVYIDDQKKATLDLYASPAQYKVTLWTSDTLLGGTHHMDLVRNKDSLSTEFLVLDAVDVWGNIIAAPPTITSLSPSSGSVDGGTYVTINGAGFTGLVGPSAVTFDGANATSYTVNSSTKITAVAPAHAAGTVPVQVTTSSGTASSTFTYAVAPPTTRLDVRKTTATTTPGTVWSGTWASYTTASAYGGSYMRSSTSGAYVLVAFKGTRLDWITMKGTTGGIADIYVDGSTTKAASINLYASSPIYQRNLWSTGTLPDGYHTVKIVRSPSSISGRYVTIDAVEIAGTLVAPTRIEENASPSPFTWSPVFNSWTTGTTTSASGGTYKYINTAGAYVGFTFTGVGFQIIAKTAPSYGDLTVTVDGVAQTVSLYSSTTTYKKIVLTKFVAPGTHVVKISRAGTKSTSSSGYTVDLDAINLYGVTR